MKTIKEKDYKELIYGVLLCIERLDREMTKPSTQERGSRIAKICNELNLHCDSAMHSELGYSFDKIKKIKDKIHSTDPLPQMNIERIPKL